MKSDEDGIRSRRKLRTREHVIADLSENHVERLVLNAGHLLRRPARDYAIDVTMFHFGEDGQIENGEVRFQLKATDDLKIVSHGESISIPIKTGDLHYWAFEIFPFILIIYESAGDRAWFLHIQEYVSQHPDVLDPDRKTVNVHVPVSNSLSVETIEYFRQQSLETIERIRPTKGNPDAKFRPK